MNLNLYSQLIILGLTGFTCLALGFITGYNYGYKEGCADTINMYEWFSSDDKNLNQYEKNKKILDMFKENQ